MIPQDPWAEFGAVMGLSVRFISSFDRKDPNVSAIQNFENHAVVADSEAKIAEVGKRLGEVNIRYIDGDPEARYSRCRLGSGSPPAPGRMANMENLYLGLSYLIKDQVV